MKNVDDLALCIDCLSLHRTVLNEDGFDSVICHCGGETCSCEGCRLTISKLMFGILDYKELGLISPITKWNAKEGFVNK